MSRGRLETGHGEHAVFHGKKRKEQRRARSEGETEKGRKSEGVAEDRKKANNRDEGFRASLSTFLPLATNVAVSYEKKKEKEKEKRKKKKG